MAMSDEVLGEIVAPSHGQRAQVGAHAHRGRGPDSGGELERCEEYECEIYYFRIPAWLLASSS
jgi:hypothetical protein